MISRYLKVKLGPKKKMFCIVWRLSLSNYLFNHSVVRSYQLSNSLWSYLLSDYLICIINLYTGSW